MVNPASLGRDFEISVADLDGEFHTLSARMSIKNVHVERAINDYNQRVEGLCKRALEMECGTRVMVSPMKNTETIKSIEAFPAKVTIEWEYRFMPPGDDFVFHGWTLYDPWRAYDPH